MVDVKDIDMSIKTYQVRTNGTNQEQVESLQFSDPKTWQPIVLKPDVSGKYAIVSGFHRVSAVLELMKPNDAHKEDVHNGKMKAVILDKDLSYSDTILAAYKFNSEHGLHLTTADKKNYAIEIYKVNPTQAHYIIAKTVHLSDKTVTAAINEYIASQQPKPETQEQAPSDEQAPSEDNDTTTEDIKAYKSCANALRRFSENVLTEDDTEYVVHTLAECLNRKEGTDKHISDHDMLQEVIGVLTQVQAKIAPKPTKKSTKGK